MEIFGKRPFVLKTDELKGKLEAIDRINVDVGVDDVNKVIGAVRNWLSLVANQARLYKTAQTLASDIRKILSKKELSEKDRGSIRTHLDTLNNIDATLLSAAQKIIRDVAYHPIPTDRNNDNYELVEILNSYEKNGQEGQADRKKLIDAAKTKMKKLEEGCRKTKQALKDKFDEVYKLLNPFAKNVQKAYDKSYKEYQKKFRKEVGKATLDVTQVENIVNKGITDFEKYGIDIDEKFVEDDSDEPKIDPSFVPKD